MRGLLAYVTSILISLMCGEFVVGVKAVQGLEKVVRVLSKCCSSVVEVLSKRRRSVVRVLDKYGNCGVTMMRL